MANTGPISRPSRLFLLLLLLPLATSFGWWVIEDGATVAATPESATAVFRGSDKTTAGNWVGRYGAQGHGLGNDSLKYPAYANVAISGGTPYTWEVPTSDSRGLQRPSSDVRVATCWYAVTSLTIDVNLTDGVPHQVALYAVDFTAYARAESIDVIDAVTGAVLDTRTLAAFQDGEYLVWVVSGHVILRVTNTGPINAVFSGLFFDSPPVATAVTLTSPAARASYGAMARIPLSATATALTGHSIARVDFLAGTTVIGSLNPSPYVLSAFTMTWTNALAGTHALTARATDDTGAAFTSSPVTVTVTAAANQGGGLPAGALSAKRISATDLVYQGSFRLPYGAVGGSSFDYGGTALTFNSVGGSLFMVGHDWQQEVAEVAVPAIRRATSPSDLAVATVLQPFTDATEGRLRSGVEPDTSAPVKVGGLLAYHNQLYLTAYVFYDASGAQQLSHFVSGLDLSVLHDVRGPYQVGRLGAGFVSGYFGLIPDEWQQALGGPVLSGQCCLSIITRTSFGPAAFAIDPAKLGTTNPLPAVPLVYYTSDHQLGQYGGQSTLFNGTTQMGGVVFPEGTRSVLFFGQQGLGPSCYGEGTSDRALVGTGPAGDPFCYDPVLSSKGDHAYPYASYVWAYDAVDLVSVKNGQRQPWDVKPYAVWSLDLPFAGSPRILGAAYDPRTSRIFVSQAYADAANPLIHVFTVRP